MSSYFFHHHTREEVAQKAEAGYSVVIPLAATEQHGPHLPVYTDTIICEHICKRAVGKASQTVPILLTPIISIGCSDHHLRFNGTISYSSSTYLQMLADIGESLVKCGFKKIIFINGHGGNEHIMHQTTSDLAVKHPIWTASASYWRIAAKTLSDIQAGEVGLVPGHAGGFEASLIMALQPDLVRTGRIASTHERKPWVGAGISGAFVGKHGELTGVNGFTDAPNMASAERGHRYLNGIVEAVSDWLVQTAGIMDEGRDGKE